jgi:GNAT superfamily N-acetyltransferase
MRIRPATAADAAAVADIDLDARAVALPSVRGAYGVPDVRNWIATVLIPGGDVWVAEQDGAILGYMALKDDWVGQLYLRPDHWRRGIGSALIAHARALRPAGLRLWCFQVNTRARAFYAAHGFTIDRMTDGADNEEHEPDILYIWRPA